MNCKLCNRTFIEVEALCLHVKWFHYSETEYSCIFNGCYRKFSSITSFKKHVICCEKSDVKNSGEQSQTVPSVATADGSSETEKSKAVENAEDVQNAESTTPENSGLQDLQNKMENSILNFFSKLYSNTTITNAVIQEIMTEFIDYTENIINILSESIKLKLPSDYQKVIDELDCSTILHNFNSDYKRKKFLENANTLIRPEEICLGEIDDDKTDKKINARVKTKKKCFTYVIPIRKTLKEFLQLPNVFHELTTFIASETTVYSSKKVIYTSLFQGKRWKDISLHFIGKIVIPIFIYYDDFEVNNPLMPSAGVYKIGGLYFSIAGLPPKFSSAIKNIFLAQFIYTTDLKEFKNHKSFTRIIEELQFLANEGIDIEIDGKTQRVYFVTIGVVGDNLGLNQILGLSGSFISKNFCRICRMCKDDAHKCCIEIENLLRNEENYKEDLENLTNGIKSYCCFHEVPFFHLALNRVADIMHDIYCGCGRYLMAKIIKYFIKENFFTLDRLNQRLKYFDYSQTDRGNRVSSISEKHIEDECLTITAAEMSFLISYFTMIIGDLIPDDDPVWLLYLDFYEIVEIVTSDVVSEDDLIFLESLVQSFNQAYIELFQENLKPKFHLLTHYTTVIRTLGPLKYLSCHKFEAFHKLSKKYAHLVNSRINILLTLSIKIQLLLSFRIISKEGLQDVFEFGKTDGLVKNINTLPLKPDEAVKVSFVKVNGLFYRNNTAILVKIDSFTNMPVFAVIESIYTDYNKIIFIIKKCLTVGYLDHIKCYEIIYPHKNFNEEMYEFNVINFIRPMKMHITNDRKLVISKRDL